MKAITDTIKAMGPQMAARLMACMALFEIPWMDSVTERQLINEG
jgi:hypothetical protein